MRGKRTIPPVHDAITITAPGVADTDPRPLGQLTTGKVAKKIGVHLTTVRDWIVIGTPLPDGTRVRLRAVRLAGRWRVRDDDLQAFIDRCTQGALPRDDGAETAGHPVPSKSRKAHLDRVQAELKAMGL